MASEPTAVIPTERRALTPLGDGWAVLDRTGVPGWCSWGDSGNVQW